MNAAPKIPVERIREILRAAVDCRARLARCGLDNAEHVPARMTLAELEAVCQQAIDAMAACVLNEQHIAKLESELKALRALEREVRAYENQDCRSWNGISAALQGIRDDGRRPMTRGRSPRRRP